MNKNRLFQIGKIIIVLLTVMLMAPAFSTGKYSTKTFDEVSAAMLEGLDLEKYPAQDVLAIKRYFDLDPGQFVQAAFYRTNDAMDAEEILLVQYDDAQAREAFENAVRTRQAAQENVYEGYAPDQLDLTQKAEIDVQGNFGLYVVGAQAQQADNQFAAGL